MECNPEQRAGHRQSWKQHRLWSSKKVPKLSNHRWALLLGGAAREPSNQHRDYTNLSYFICLASYYGMVCCPPRGRGGQLPVAVPAVLSIASQVENGPPALLVAPHKLRFDFPQSCHPQGGARSLMPQAPQPVASVQERRGWNHTSSIAGTGPSKGMGSACVWKHGYLIGPFFAPIFIASHLNYTNEVFSCFVPRDPMH